MLNGGPGSSYGTYEHTMAVLAEFEGNLINEQTRLVLAAARWRGSQLGRRRALSPAQRSQALELFRYHFVAKVADQFRARSRTILRLKPAGA